MTEKRFTEIVSIETIKDNKTGKSYAHCLVTDEFFELINTLADENKQLKEENQALKDFVTVNFSDMMAEKMEVKLKE